MATILNFSDPSQPSISIADGNRDITTTPISLLGRRYPESYSKDIGENFLHILENFASIEPPSNPVKGQLWYNSNNLQEVDLDSSSNTTDSFGLKIYTGIDWLPVGITKKSAVSPSSGNLQSNNLKRGDLYVDTSKNQLYIYNGGGGYSLVGPSFNSLERTGIEVEEIINSEDGIPVPVISFFVKARRVAIHSDILFEPKLIYEGFKIIKPGLNLCNSSKDQNTKYWGVSEKASALIVGADSVSGNNFLRSDAVSTTNYRLNVRSNDGLTIGLDSSISFFRDTSGGKTTAIIYNNNDNAPIDFRIKQANVNNYTTTMRITNAINNEGLVGINKLNPNVALDIVGSISATKDLNIKNIESSGSLSVRNNTNLSGNLNFNSQDILVSNLTGIIQLASGSTTQYRVIGTNTTDLQVGMKLTKISGPGIFGTNAKIVSISGNDFNFTSTLGMFPGEISFNAILENIDLGKLIDSNDIIPRVQIIANSLNPNDQTINPIANLGSDSKKWDKLFVNQIGDSTGSNYPVIYGNIIANQLVVGGPARTQITGNLTANPDIGSITVKSTLNFPDSGSIIIDTEEFVYTGRTSTQFTNVTRGKERWSRTKRYSIGDQVVHEGKLYRAIKDADNQIYNENKNPVVQIAWWQLLNIPFTIIETHALGTFVFLKLGDTRNFGIVDGLSRGLSDPITLTTTNDSDIRFIDSRTNNLSIPLKNAGEVKNIRAELSQGFIANKTEKLELVNNDYFLCQNGANYFKVSKASLAKNLPTVPIGTTILFSGVLTKIPPGYVPCDGRELVKSEYLELFEIYGGAVNNSGLNRYRPSVQLPSFGIIETFAVPDLRNQVPTFSTIELIKGLTYTIIDPGNTNWEALGFVDPTITVTAIQSNNKFMCSIPMLVDQKITITGTLTGVSITGYTSGNSYYIIETDGATYFKLSANKNGTSVQTTTGTPLGVIFYQNQEKYQASFTTNWVTQSHPGNGTGRVRMSNGMTYLVYTGVLDT